MTRWIVTARFGLYKATDTRHVVTARFGLFKETEAAVGVTTRRYTLPILGVG